eukprot:COSAG04_NODE_5136_length_1724_cov_0.960615_1_plen_132_part_10
MKKTDEYDLRNFAHSLLHIHFDQRHDQSCYWLRGLRGSRTALNARRRTLGFAELDPAAIGATRTPSRAQCASYAATSWSQRALSQLAVSASTAFTSRAGPNPTLFSNALLPSEQTVRQMASRHGPHIFCAEH